MFRQCGQDVRVQESRVDDVPRGRSPHRRERSPRPSIEGILASGGGGIVRAKQCWALPPRDPIMPSIALPLVPSCRRLLRSEERQQHLTLFAQQANKTIRFAGLLLAGDIGFPEDDGLD